jgi:hypothetical protein
MREIIIYHYQAALSARPAAANPMGLSADVLAGASKRKSSCPIASPI